MKPEKVDMDGAKGDAGANIAKGYELAENPVGVKGTGKRHKRTGRCMAKRQDGEQCEAKALADGLCKRHHEIGAGVFREELASDFYGVPYYGEKFNPKVAAEAVERVRMGFTQQQVSKMLGMPAPKVMWLWKRDNQQFRREIDLAREENAHKLVDEIVPIADNMEIEVNRARLMVEARKAAAALINPRRYGRQLNVEGDITGGLADALHRAQQRMREKNMIKDVTEVTS